MELSFRNLFGSPNRRLCSLLLDPLTVQSCTPGQTDGCMPGAVPAALGRKDGSFVCVERQTEASWGCAVEGGLSAAVKGRHTASPRWDLQLGIVPRSPQTQLHLQPWKRVGFSCTVMSCCEQDGGCPMSSPLGPAPGALLALSCVAAPYRTPPKGTCLLPISSPVLCKWSLAGNAF